MISFLSDWIQKITISIIIVSIFELILPKGNLKKYIKVVLGIYIIFCMISPFVNNSIWSNLGDFNLEDYVQNISEVEEVSENFSTDDIYIDELKNNIKNKLKNEGYEVDKCDIKANLSKNSENPGIHEINLIISKKEDENKNNIKDINIKIDKKEEKESKLSNEEINKIKEILSSHYEISKDIIEIKSNIN